MYSMRVLGIIFCVIIFSQSGMAQKASQREWTIFRKGLDDYNAGQYSSAEKNFSLVISKLPNNKLLTANFLMLAKTKYKQEKYQESINYCDQFIARFPLSSYRDDVYFLKGNNNYQLKKYDQALSNWLDAADQNSNRILYRRAIGQAEDVVRYRLDERDLINLKNKSISPFSKHFLLYHLAERYYDKGNAASALIMLEELTQNPDTNLIYTEKANRLYQLLKSKKSNMIRIAALLPLSGDHEEYGKQVLSGAKMAVEEYNRLPGVDVEIVTFDYETRLITAITKFKEIAMDPSINAVFGPIENDITAACAALADYEKIPIISPTSSENKLTELSSLIIQLATPVDVISENLVADTYDSLRFQRVVTLSPIDGYFIEMTQAFIRKHLENGGEIIAEQWYYPGDKDFSKQFKQLKRIGLNLTFQDSVLSVDSTFTQMDIDSMYKAYIEEQKTELAERGTKIDSADIPVTSFDAIFIPVYKEDINLIAPQFAYSNIQAQILGNADWYDPESLKKNKNYLNGMIFISDGYINEESWDYRQFRNNYRMKYQRTPEKFDLIGFDCFNFILNAISESNNIASRNDFVETLKVAPKYNGIFRHFDIGQNRYNDSTRILKYWHGVIVPFE